MGQQQLGRRLNRESQLGPGKCVSRFHGNPLHARSGNSLMMMLRVHDGGLERKNKDKAYLHRRSNPFRDLLV